MKGYIPYQNGIQSTIDYYPFGMEMPGRVSNASAYRFGMNGQMKDNEFTGQDGAHTTAMFWEYDSRVGRRWNTDPRPVLGISNYSCFANNPILNRDVLGDTISFNFFRAVKDIYNLVADTRIKHQVHDGTYAVFGHGSRKALWNSQGERLGDPNSVIKQLSKNKYFRQDFKEGKPITLLLLTCHSGEGYANIAQQISENFTNITVIAADGAVWYGKNKSGKPDIIGVDNEKNNNGGFIKYQRGERISKMQYSYNKKTGEYNVGFDRNFNTDPKGNTNREESANDKKSEKNKKISGD